VGWLHIQLGCFDIAKHVVIVTESLYSLYVFLLSAAEFLPSGDGRHLSRRRVFESIKTTRFSIAIIIIIISSSSSNNNALK